MNSTTRTPGAPGRGFKVRGVGEPPDRDPRAAADPEGRDGRPDEAAAPVEPPVEAAPVEAAPIARMASRRRPRALTAVLALVSVLAIAAAVTFGLEWRATGSQTAAQNPAASSARSLVVALTNFDPGTVAPDFSRIKSMSTGTFATQAAKFFATSIGKQLSQAGAASRGKVTALDVQSVTGTNASVFAVVSQTYLNDKQKTPLTDVLRLVIGLTDVSGHWLVSSVQVLLQQPVG